MSLAGGWQVPGGLQSNFAHLPRMHCMSAPGPWQRGGLSPPVHGSPCLTGFTSHTRSSPLPLHPAGPSHSWTIFHSPSPHDICAVPSGVQTAPCVLGSHPPKNRPLADGAALADAEVAAMDALGPGEPASTDVAPGPAHDPHDELHAPVASNTAAIGNHGRIRREKEHQRPVRVNTPSRVNGWS